MQAKQMPTWHLPIRLKLQAKEESSQETARFQMNALSAGVVRKHVRAIPETTLS